MFNMFKGNKQLLSPITGNVISLIEVEDPVFGQKILGDGVALVPKENKVYAPCDGTIVQITPTKHALCIESTEGLELLIHMGIDTVKLNGEGFTLHVNEGDKVHAGQLISEMDTEFIKSKGYSTKTPFIITNLDTVKSIELHLGEAVHSETAVISYK